MGNEVDSLEQHVLHPPSRYVVRATWEATAKLPENAAITHWGTGVITESFCPRLPTVISLKDQQLRH